MISHFLAAALFMAPAPPLPSPAPPPAAEAAIPAEQLALLRGALEQAPLHGLDARRFLPDGLDALLNAPDPAARRRGEGLLLQAAARYGAAVRSGGLPPQAFPSEWAQRPAPYDAAGELSQALAAGRVTQWLLSLPPPGEAYAQLQTVLARYEALAAAGGWPVLAAGKTLQLHAADDRVVALRQRLAAEDPDVDVGQGRVFDETLVEAVTGYQARHGLSPTGKLDAPTVRELNIPVAARIDQIRANLERRRWAPRNPAPTRIEVNVAAQTLDYYRDGAPVLTMRTIVGRPANRTPLFLDQVESIVLNPPWNVPPAIAAKEIWPKARRDSGYLARNDYVVLPGPGGSRLQQRPGPKSALGRVKFDLPNSFDVYLHDTPNHRLFEAASRAFSHGCIRLDQPIPLANLLLQGDPKWTPQEVAAVLEGVTTIHVPLSRPLPVAISYWTVFVDRQGRTQFRPDLYGWDAKLIRLRDG